jgi:aquaporin NIP
MRSSKSKLLAEAIGTFCLVFAGTGAVVVDQVTGGKVGNLGISLVFGLIVLAMVYAIGHVSGAHMNPAVTVGFCVTGRHKTSELLPYVAVQLVGAAAASLTLRMLFAGQPTTLGVTLPVGSVAQSFVMEVILSFILMFVIMGVATDDRAEGATAGIAIGAVIALEAAFGGPISGASMNPARSFAPALVDGNFTHHWVYWIAPICGTISGARAYMCVQGEA